jgi:putative endonuclease
VAAGARAEAHAVDYLRARGVAIVARNFRTRHGEIDIVARDRNVLVFIEVRRRGSGAFGGAAASITARKRARLVLTAQAYLATLPKEPPCRFDAILLDGPDPTAIEWQRDVFSVD